MLMRAHDVVRPRGFFAAELERYGLRRVRVEVEREVAPGHALAVRPHPDREEAVNLGEMLMVEERRDGALPRWWLEWATFEARVPCRLKVVERTPPTFKPIERVDDDRVLVPAGAGEDQRTPAMPWGTTIWEAGEDVPWWSVGTRFWGHPRHFAGHDGTTRWSPDKPPTPARALYVVGDDAHDHWFDLPRHGGLPPQRLKEVTRNWDGTGPRTIRILLPRGYDVLRRSYPVCYWHDGQNMFAKSRPLGHWVEPWGLAQAVDRLARRGEITDAIHVAVDQSSRRLLEYLPPSDRLDLDDEEVRGKAGEADAYLALLREKIHPYVVSHFRVLDDPQYTGIAGSSMGGLVSMYAGWNHPDFARRLGVFSASFWAAPSFVEDLDGAGAGARRPLLVYLDSGTVGPTHDNIDGVLRVRDALLRQGWTLGFDLRHVVGLGDPHNERAWRRRLDDCLRFLYPAGDSFHQEEEDLYAERVRGTVWQRHTPPATAGGRGPASGGGGGHDGGSGGAPGTPGAHPETSNTGHFHEGGFAW